MSDDVTPVSASASADDQPAKPRRHRRTKAEMAAARAQEAAAREAAEKAGEPWPPKRRRTRSKASAPEKPAPAHEESAPAREDSVKQVPSVPEPSAEPASEATRPVAGEPASHKTGAPKRRRTHRHDEAPASSPTASASAPDEMTQLTQEATKASSEPTQMPAQTLGAPSFEHRRETSAHAPVPANRQPQADSSHMSRKHRRPGDHSGSGNGYQSSRQANNQGGQNNQGRHRNRRQQDSSLSPSLTRDELVELKVAELRSKAAELGVEYVGVRKPELVEAVYAAAAQAEGFRPVEGILEIGNEGYGWIRTGNYMEGDGDAFVYQQLIRSLGLRPGDRVAGTVGPGRSNSKYPPLQSVRTVNGQPPEGLKVRPRFRDLTPVFPNERLAMECDKSSITGRAIDLVSPIGKGQRGLIVSPPKAGKTTVLKKICQSIAANNPEVHLFCLLVDERPEEVTDMERSIKGEVVASTFDMPADNHTRVSELVIEHAKRLVETGEDVVVVLDSITRLARAYNLAQPASGRILSGGVDSAALYPPKRFLGAARNIENGGSLTIIASALVDTGSKMDEVIFEEFKGTGNMELKLDRDLADKRIFPAIDPVSSGTRNEDLLIDAEYQPFVWGIRRVLANMNNTERAANALIKGLRETESNSEFLILSAKKAQKTGYIA
jgi:transcription termination factor Rho